MWTKQCHHFPWCILVEAMVLVVMACSSSRNSMAPATSANSWVRSQEPSFFQVSLFYSCVKHEDIISYIVFGSCRYGSEMPMVFIQSVIYLGILILSRLARQSLSKLCNRRGDRGISFFQITIKITVFWAILASYILPFFFIPTTIHPVIGWGLYLFGSLTLLSVSINAFLLPTLAVLLPWLGILGSLLVMANPWYSNGVVRALAVFFYAFCCSPIIWVSFVKVLGSLHASHEKEPFYNILGESSSPPRSNKLC